MAHAGRPDPEGRLGGRQRHRARLAARRLQRAAGDPRRLPGRSHRHDPLVVRHPIYPDVVSFALGDYAVTRSALSLAAGRRTPLELYAFPEDSDKVAADLAPVPAILRFLEDRLGPYPYADEKYAVVEFARPSFREGQTLSHVGTALFTGTRENEQVIAHEVAHQWFGNALTVASWADIWLNEGLAEYMAWQWIRRSRGEVAYQALLDSAVAAPTPKPIVPADPADFASLFGDATFQRGPAVLVLLERELGTTAFRRALRDYVGRHAGGTVGTEDFQHAAEQASGRSLDAFFAGWIRGAARLPRERAVLRRCRVQPSRRRFRGLWPPPRPSPHIPPSHTCQPPAAAFPHRERP